MAIQSGTYMNERPCGAHSDSNEPTSYRQQCRPVLVGRVGTSVGIAAVLSSLHVKSILRNLLWNDR